MGLKFFSLLFFISASATTVFAGSSIETRLMRLPIDSELKFMDQVLSHCKGMSTSGYQDCQEEILTKLELSAFPSERAPSSDSKRQAKHIKSKSKKLARKSHRSRAGAKA